MLCYVCLYSIVVDMMYGHDVLAWCIYMEKACGKELEYNEIMSRVVLCPVCAESLVYACILFLVSWWEMSQTRLNKCCVSKTQWLITVREDRDYFLWPKTSAEERPGLIPVIHREANREDQVWFLWLYGSQGNLWYADPYRVGSMTQRIVHGGYLVTCHWCITDSPKGYSRLVYLSGF